LTKDQNQSGGLDSLIDWIDNNNTLMNKSDTLTRKQFVAVQVWVDTTGNPFDIGIIRGMGKPYDQEAYRLITECPIRWTPGELRKKKITMRLVIPVYFTRMKK
jgi:hypothetical protein